ncbi:MAG: hypothetical protein HOP28_07710 [Gemmatimonadales bacterium]|nr:hypothetical protein [Gemmatimonadales bacterium]
MLLRLAVLGMLLVAGTVAAQSPPAIITGRVFDSLRMVPLGGVIVQIVGTTQVTRSLPDGTFRLTTELRGPHVVRFDEPRLRRFEGASTADVDLRPGRATHINLAVRRRHLSPTEFCVDSTRRAIPGSAAVGVLRDSASGEPVSGARVLAYWAPSEADSGVSARGLEVESDADGGFLVCGLPVNRTYSLVATLPGRGGSLEGRRSVADSVVDADLLLKPTGNTETFARLVGQVTDATTGARLALAEVELLLSGLRATTNSSGEFRMERLPAGAANVAIRRVGYRPRVLPVVLSEGKTTTLSGALTSAPVLLPDVNVRADAPRLARHGFMERVRLGLGVFWDGAELKRQEGRDLDVVLATRTRIRQRTRTDPTLINAIRGRQCRIPIAIDGILFVRGDDRGLSSEGPMVTGRSAGGGGLPAGSARLQVPGENVLNLYRPEDLEGIEFYDTPTRVPTELVHLASRCGLLALWTK